MPYMRVDKEATYTAKTMLNTAADKEATYTGKEMPCKAAHKEATSTAKERLIWQLTMKPLTLGMRCLI